MTKDIISQSGTEYAAAGIEYTTYSKTINEIKSFRFTELISQRKGKGANKILFDH